jgi:hypothetical protein
MMKTLIMAAALVAIGATATTAQVQQPRIQMPSPGPQLSPQINRDIRPIPDVRPQDGAQAAPEAAQAALGYYRTSDGKLRLYRGCHWVNPDSNSDLGTYCD